MSELRASTISALNGTDPVVLTKQWASRGAISLNQSTNAINFNNNVSSVTDLAVGNHTINWSNSFNSATEQASVNAGRYDTTAFDNSAPNCGIRRTNSVLTTSLTISAHISTLTSTSEWDCDIHNVITFGELA